ncbi:MAG: hypothetical protein AMXMBFR13_10770 [Phycisphaerae bacterium]
MRRKLLVSCVLMGLPAVLLAGAWRLGGVSALEDDLLYYLPIRQYIGERIRAGEWPLWNPLVSMGTSVAADPQAGLWYPPTWLFGLLPPLLAYPVTLVLHFTLAGAGMYRFLRSLRHDWRAAFLGAVAFEFCGYLVAHRAHLTIHHAAAWLPWMLLAWQRFADTGRLGFAALGAGALGLQLLVQHAQISIISAAIVTGYAALVLWPQRRTLAWVFPVGMACGALVAGIQILPTLVHYTHSVRGAPAYYLFIENSWVPSSALMLLFPMLFGTRTPNLWDEPWWGISHYCEQSAYATILILVLAVSSVALLRSPAQEATSASDTGRGGWLERLLGTGPWNRNVLFWWAACLVALLIALGDATPLSKLLFHLPIYRSLRVPARWILVWSVAMPLLASVVMTELLRRGPHAERLERFLSVILRRLLPAAALIGILVVLLAHAQVEHLESAIRTPLARPVLAGLALAGRLDNPAIWWPVLIMVLTGTVLLRWLRSRSRAGLLSLGAVFLLDLASVAAFVDVDVRMYTRADLEDPPPLAGAIHELAPGPGERLLVPRATASYHRPLEVLWPQTNLRYGIATLHGYGPLWSAANRLLLRFMPWGSSEEMLALLRNVPLLRALGVRFVAVRSDEERLLLEAALLPPDEQSHDLPVPGSGDMRLARYGQDLKWGPVTAPAPGVYKLAFDAQPVAGTASRWFVRLEKPDQEEIDRTRSLDPVDLAFGPRRMSFLYDLREPMAAIHIHVKAEMGEALFAGHATWRRVAVAPAATMATGRARSQEGSFRHLADLPDEVSLYELRGARPLVYWASRVAVAANLHEAAGLLESSRGQFLARGGVVAELPTGSSVPDTTGDDPVKLDRSAGHELIVSAGSKEGGLLVLNESFDPGWEAWVDGVRVSPVRVNAVVQGIEVPAGEHRIVFRYRPAALRSGAGLTAAGLLILLGMLVLSRRLPGAPGAEAA